MNKKNMILLSSLLVCSLESFAQNKVEATDSILKDMDLDAVTVVASKPLVKMETDKMTYNVQQDADANKPKHTGNAARDHRHQLL